MFVFKGTFSFTVKISFNITDGNTGDAFAINDSGVVTTTKKLDRETVSSYSLTVRYVVAVLSPAGKRSA